MTTIRERIHELGLELPPAPQPLGAYTPVVRAGGLVYTSGQLPVVNGELIVQGKVPADVTVPQAQACAMQAALNALAAVEAEVESLESVRQVVRVTVYVNSSPGFTDQASVANGASELLLKAFGSAGRHTRCAIGAAELPKNSPVEVDVIFEV